MAYEGLCSATNAWLPGDFPRGKHEPELPRGTDTIISVKAGGPQGRYYKRYSQNSTALLMVMGIYQVNGVKNRPTCLIDRIDGQITKEAGLS